MKPDEKLLEAARNSIAALELAALEFAALAVDMQRLSIWSRAIIRETLELPGGATARTNKYEKAALEQFQERRWGVEEVYQRVVSCALTFQAAIPAEEHA